MNQLKLTGPIILLIYRLFFTISSLFLKAHIGNDLRQNASTEKGTAYAYILCSLQSTILSVYPFFNPLTTNAKPKSM